MLNEIFLLQGQYPFVFGEYPETAKALIDLRAACGSVKSAFWWYGAGDSIDIEKRRTLVERNLVKLIKACDEVNKGLPRNLE